ncbi:alpha/beta hydrolase [Amycolatopsis plumensis]|uniref:Alpha/beta hydrolase n=1 Tax=Amycolatopsis plumensis TaxID=236508 RepID=A0ABV5ULB7_9PSEU
MLTFVGVVVLTCLTLFPPAASAASRPPSGLRGVPIPALAWAPCDTSGDGYECAIAQVPLDYRNPGGRKIALSVIRKPATDPAHRIGSLFTSPGGPGLEAFYSVRDLGSSAPQVLRERYDIVGFDPRGVGGSARVTCVSQPVYSKQWAASTGRPSSGGFERAIAFGKQFNDGCVLSDAELLPYMGTEFAARDMDLLRAAMGDERLNFFGFSYGTYLGTVYANLFPERVRVLALDGGIEPDSYTNDPYRNNYDQYVAADASLTRFLTWCLKSPTQCAFGGGHPVEAFRVLQASLDADPVRASDGRVIATGALFSFWVSQELGGGRANWPMLAGYLQEVATKRSGWLVREISPGYTTYMNNNAVIECGDRRFPRDTALLRSNVSIAVAAAPLLGPALAYGPPSYDQGNAQSCAQWPAERLSSYSGPWSAPGVAPVLVVGTTNDPDVPYQHAVKLSRTLQNARLLTFQGETHTTWFYSECSKAYITRYLVDGTLPPPNSVCADEALPAGT